MTRASLSLRQRAWIFLAMSAMACGTEPEAGPGSERELDAAIDMRDASIDTRDASIDTRDASIDAKVALDAARPRDAEVGLDAERADATGEGWRPTLLHVDGRPIQGKRIDETNGFLGIRYAKPPVGALRFAAPEPADPWQGTLDATSFGAMCPQAPTRGSIPGPDLPESEDCLSLNVWVPARASSEKLPVMFFIHGGRFTLGSGADLEAQYLSAHEDVVVVAINYRLGALGWLVHDAFDRADVPSGNFGLRDQQLALRWVHEHIADFGGDPENVTVFGQSAGSQGACYHLFARGSEGLFQRMIMESGTCVDYPALPLRRDLVANMGKLIVDALCPASQDVAGCMRALPHDEIVDWARPGLPGPMGEDFSPQVDGKLLEIDPWKQLRAGDFQRVPLIIGSTNDEWGAVKLYSGADAPRPKNNLELALVAYGMYPNEFTDILALYAPLGSPDANANDALGSILSDSWFHCPARTLARGAAAHGVPVYLYRFSLAPSVHGQELDYVFGYPWLSGVLTAPLFETPAPVPLLPDLKSAMQRYWGRMARDGSPNDGALPAWPRYDTMSDRHLDLNTAIRDGAGLDEERCDFWDAVFEKRHASAP
jgi:para-nitrobenzyl esterase